MTRYPYLLVPMLLVLTACAEQPDGSTRLALDADAVKAQLLAKQAEGYGRAALAAVRPYITGERDLAQLQSDQAITGTVLEFVRSSQGAATDLLAKLEAVELDGTRPLGACRDAVVSTTKLLGDFAGEAREGHSVVGLLPQLDAADQDVRRCAETSANLGLPLLGP